MEDNSAKRWAQPNQTRTGVSLSSLRLLGTYFVSRRGRRSSLSFIESHKCDLQASASPLPLTETTNFPSFRGIHFLDQHSSSSLQFLLSHTRTLDEPRAVLFHTPIAQFARRDFSLPADGCTAATRPRTFYTTASLQQYIDVLYRSTSTCQLALSATTSLFHRPIFPPMYCHPRQTTATTSTTPRLQKSSQPRRMLQPTVTTNPAHDR